jgi:cystathionine beta-lyase/cystathionine gamma-synthase
VKRVIYPDLAIRQMSGFGGMLTFQLHGGLGAAIDLSEKIKVFLYQGKNQIH